MGPHSPPAPACPDTLGDGGGTGRAGSAEPWRSGQLPALPRRLLAPAADAGLGCAREVPGGAQRGAVPGGCWGAPVRVHPPRMKVWGAFTRVQWLGGVYWGEFPMGRAQRGACTMDGILGCSHEVPPSGTGLWGAPMGESVSGCVWCGRLGCTQWGTTPGDRVPASSQWGQGLGCTQGCTQQGRCIGLHTNESVPDPPLTEAPPASP